MSADVAIQGISQDYITLFVSVPFLLISLFVAKKNSIHGLFLFIGTIAYFLVTYLFYLTIGMYNKLFLIYAFLLGTAFFTLILALLSFKINEIRNVFQSEKLLQNSEIFLIINGILVAMLWLGIIVSPLLNGTIIPLQVQHYTTLIVQGFVLGLLMLIPFITLFPTSNLRPLTSDLLPPTSN